MIEGHGIFQELLFHDGSSKKTLVAAFTEEKDAISERQEMLQAIGMGFSANLTLNGDNLGPMVQFIGRMLGIKEVKFHIHPLKIRDSNLVVLS